MAQTSTNHTQKNNNILCPHPHINAVFPLHIHSLFTPPQIFPQSYPFKFTEKMGKNSSKIGLLSFLSFTFLLICLCTNKAQGSQLTETQVAKCYGANLLSLTDAAQIIQLAADILKEDVSKQAQKDHVEKLERTTYWACAKLPQARLLLKLKVKEWQKGYSTRLCQNMYRLLAMVDIEVLMFKEKLETEVKNEHWLDLFFWKEKRVHDQDIQNFKMSRLFAFSRNLTVRFLRIGNTSHGRQLLLAEPYEGKSINTAYYLDLLRGFDKKTLELLRLMEQNEKFKMAENETFWSMLKKKKDHVVKAFQEDAQHRNWDQMEEDRAMLLKIYESMSLGIEVDLSTMAVGKSEIYENKKEPWFIRLVKKNDENDETKQNDIVQLYEEHPWYMPRIHKMVEIYAQIHMNEKAEADGVLEEHLKVDVHKKGKNKSTENMALEHQINNKEKDNIIMEDHEKEHPKYWHLSSIQREEIAIKSLDKYDILNLLKVFDTETFSSLKHNKGSHAFKQFFEKHLQTLPNVEVRDSIVQKFGKQEDILTKVESTLGELNLVFISNKVEIPVRLGDEIFSYEEENMFTMGIFYELAVAFATDYVKIKKPKPNPEKETDHKEKHRLLHNVVDLFEIDKNDGKVPIQAQQGNTINKSPSGRHLHNTQPTAETIAIAPATTGEKEKHHTHTLADMLHHHINKHKENTKRKRSVNGKTLDNALQNMGHPKKEMEQIDWHNSGQDEFPEQLLFLYQNRLAELMEEIKTNEAYQNLKSVILVKESGQNEEWANLVDDLAKSLIPRFKILGLPETAIEKADREA